MRRSFLFIMLVLAGHSLLGQDSLLLDLNETRLQLNRINMWVLGGWAVGNLAVSGVLRSQSEGTIRYFHEMNVFWNVVNLGLAAGGLYGAYTGDPGLGLWESFQEQQKLEKILLFNMALNFTYLTAGGYLIERSRRPNLNNPARLKGYGQSLLLQGGFLLVFDITQYLLHHNQATPKLQQLLESVEMGPGGIGLIWHF